MVNGKQVHHSPFTIHHSPFTIHHSPFTIQHSTFNNLHFAILFLPHCVQRPTACWSTSSGDRHIASLAIVSASSATYPCRDRSMARDGFRIRWLIRRFPAGPQSDFRCPRFHRPPYDPGRSNFPSPVLTLACPPAAFPDTGEA